jgi:superfamily II DNA/RNA helicase
LQIKTVKYVHSFLLKNGQRASAIHGQMQQNRRDQVLYARQLRHCAEEKKMVAENGSIL